MGAEDLRIRTTGSRPRSPGETVVREKTILLIEDDRDSREIYGAMLRHSGCQVVEATDGREGIRLAREHRPDVIVMDLGLPGMDGWAATATLKSDPSTSHIPVVAVTVHVQTFEREHATRVGCDTLLDKPCSPARLMGEITRVLHDR